MTIPKECKRLAEVDFPIAEVSKHAVREKSIRHGHPSTLHLWWARRPLASSRAMLMALLLPDPADPNCPPAFREEARAVLLAHHGRPKGWDALLGDDEGLRKGLLKFIGDFANWDYAADQNWIMTARDLVKAAHSEETPLVVDPFAGGGSIPLEALRVGCDVFASDLNPVAVLINKVMLEDIPRYSRAKLKVENNDGKSVDADGLVEALRIASAAVKAATEKGLAEFYPPDPDGSRPIAYLWARTVRCEAPNCGAEIPLVRSFWLAKKATRKRALRYVVKREIGKPPKLEFEIFEPASTRIVPDGTVNRARASCPCCNTVLAPERVRAQLSDQRGGADVSFDEKGCRIGGASLLAVVTLRPGEQGRKYRLATERDYSVAWKVHQRLYDVVAEPLAGGLNRIPNEPLPPIGTLGFRVQRYGMTEWGDLFTARQKLTLSYLCESIRVTPNTPVRNLVTLAISKFSERNNVLCDWMVDVECPGHLFTSHTVPPSWDFAEADALSGASGSLSAVLESTIDNLQASIVRNAPSAQVALLDASSSTLPDDSATVWFTDPPYYNAIPYSDLSDFFLVWLKRMQPENQMLQDPFAPNNPLSPKDQEAVQDESKLVDGRPKDKLFFETKMAEAFVEGARVLRSDGIGGVVFAHKTTEGWEALLSSLIGKGWIVRASWPLATERYSRMRARNSAALATSVHLVCRPRLQCNNTGDWNNVFRGLSPVVAAWMTRLESEGIRGADLVFACIGPALELYSQYSEVVDAEDRPIPLGGDPTASEPHKRGYLAYVWETVARLALQRVLGTAEASARNGAAGALEEDARLTALFLWTLQATDAEDLPAAEAEDNEAAGEDSEDDEDESSGTAKKRKGGMSLPFDVARRFAQPLGIHLPEWENRIIDTDKGVVRLLAVSERARQLFGEEGAEAVAGQLERNPLSARDMQMNLFAPEERGAVQPSRTRGSRNVEDGDLAARRGATTLDRVHAAMLLQKSGRTNALRALLAAEQERGPAFLRLANALSGLYPKQSEEKRLVDAMLLIYPK